MRVNTSKIFYGVTSAIQTGISSEQLLFFSCGSASIFLI